MVNDKLKELHTQIGLVHDIMRITPETDPRTPQLRAMLAEMYNRLKELEPAQEKLNNKLLSEGSL